MTDPPVRSLLLTYDYPPIVGGIANVLALFWRLCGHSGSLILAPGGLGARQFDSQHPVRTIRYPVIGVLGPLGKTVTFLLALLWAAACLVRYRPDLVMAGQLVRAGPIALAWHRLTGRPFDVWVYGGETSPSFTSLPPLTRHLHGVLARARTIFSNSPFTTQEMIAFGLDPERVVELPLGADQEVYRPGAKDPAYVERLGLANRLVFLTVGRLVARKGVDSMLSALGEMREELPPWHYLVVSDGPHRPQLEALAADLGIESCVTFTGYVEETELPVYYNLCDIFAMPNREVQVEGGNSLSVEGFGIVFLEAAACGKPVIAGHSGGAVYAVEDGVSGFSVDPADPEALKHAIRQLLAPERRQAMGQAGIEFAGRFSWERSAEILKQYL